MKRRLLIALLTASVALSGCGKKTEEAPVASAPAAAPAGTPTVVPTADVSASPTPFLITPTPRPGQKGTEAAGTAELEVAMESGFVTVYVNDTSIGRFGKGESLDGQPVEAETTQKLDDKTMAGANALRVVWDEPAAPVGEVSISYTEAGDARTIASLKLDATRETKGDETLKFSLPGVSATPSASGTP